jgi:integrase
MLRIIEAGTLSTALLRMKKENNGRVRFLSPAEEQRLRGATPSARLVELDIALHTGMRLSEQYRTQLRDVDFAHRILTIADTKNGETRHIPLNDVALAAFRSLQENLQEKKMGDYVFLRVPGHGANSETGVRSPREWFDDAVEKAEIKGYTWHGHRHTFASRLVMAGVDIATVAYLLGHKTIQITMRYSHFAPKHKLDSVQKLAAYNVRNVIDFPKSRGTRTATEASKKPRESAVKAV